MSIFQSKQTYLLLLIALLGACQKSAIKVSDVNVSYISNVGNAPFISWKVDSDMKEFKQSACRILIADNLEDIEKNVGNVWDSKRRKEINQLQFRYNGTNLKRGIPYYIKVKVWDSKGNESNWENPKKFFVPINYPEDWDCKWITYKYDAKAALPVFKKKFSINKKSDIEFARLYIAAPGFYEAYLNGKKIGDHVLDPGQTNYEDYTYYTAYNINAADIKNNNVMGIMPGNGWYNQNQVWGGGLAYGQPVFICQLEIHYNNGEREIIGSDESWTWKNGPITYSNIYGGETYNALLETEDWFDFESSNGSWGRAQLADKHPVELFEQFANPIKMMDTINVKKVTGIEDNKYIFDFGQNFSGWARLTIHGAEGQQITIRFAEELDSTGNIDVRSTGVFATKVIQTSKYICKGKGTEIWEPRFTYHGFRYAEVSGLKEKPSSDLLKGIVVYSSVPNISKFSCSEENINKLHSLAKWTIKSNLHSIPTDCPHRERCGWTGDAHALVHSLFYNYDAQRFMTKYMFDMRSSARNEKKELHFGESFMDRSIFKKPKGVPTMIVPGKRTSGMATGFFVKFGGFSQLAKNLICIW
jgi:alpha-L-rhamnosidase